MDATFTRDRDKMEAEIIPTPGRRRMHRLSVWAPVAGGQNLAWMRDYPTAAAAERAAVEAGFTRAMEAVQ